MGTQEAAAAREASRSQVRHYVILQQALAVSGSREQTDTIPGLVGFTLQGLGEHNQELGPYLRALITAGRF